MGNMRIRKGTDRGIFVSSFQTRLVNKNNELGCFSWLVLGVGTLRPRLSRLSAIQDLLHPNIDTCNILKFSKCEVLCFCEYNSGQ